ncbi:prepilin-type N-terminal cleavage/methylation domain-containing protein [Geminisphaera colitermitum]|uniref:prepilin-type N-terminal cleavage/methylation domain-containing protein n=1 Tax=Geminisphaera colitermitum TaxID=1148786 RepID=UPI0005BC5BC5|nr:prepilin-type N-terminal cleavage/methylation domain-containing protein [Geminisphaera colitermitum]
MNTVTRFVVPVVRRHSRRAFTLIELLAVIAIIGVLAAIVLAVLGNVRAKARQTQCLSNLRQLQMANILYANEHKGRFVYVQSTANIPWHGDRTLTGYLDRGSGVSADIPPSMRCPDRIESGGHRSYGYNFTNINLNLPTGAPKRSEIGLLQSEIPRPSQTLAFADAVDFQISRFQSNAYVAGDTNRTHAAAYRHGNDRINIAYWDGHVKNLQRSEVASNSTLWNLNQ